MTEEKSSAVDENDLESSFSSISKEAQESLSNKEEERLQALCKKERSDNLEIEAEIKQKELMLKRMNTCLETLRLENIQLETKLNSKQQNWQRIIDGTEKYEALWNECKQRFESIPHVQKFFAVSNRNRELTANIEELKHEAFELDNEMISKLSMIDKIDKERVIALAKYMVEERPKIMKAIEEKKALAAKLTEELEVKLKERDANIKGTPVMSEKDLMMPNLFEATLDQNEAMSDQKQDKAISEFLFTHGPNGKLESLDVSKNTTDIDISLPLSPKADMPGTSENVVDLQEVLNFLSGLKKTGFSFFGESSGPDGNAQQS